MEGGEAEESREESRSWGERGTDTSVSRGTSYDGGCLSQDEHAQSSCQHADANASRLRVSRFSHRFVGFADDCMTCVCVCVCVCVAWC